MIPGLTPESWQKMKDFKPNKPPKSDSSSQLLSESPVVKQSPPKSKNVPKKDDWTPVQSKKNKKVNKQNS